jgi:hypothetical protein
VMCLAWAKASFSRDHDNDQIVGDDVGCFNDRSFLGRAEKSNNRSVIAGFGGKQEMPNSEFDLFVGHSWNHFSMKSEVELPCPTLRYADFELLSQSATHAT